MKPISLFFKYIYLSYAILIFILIVFIILILIFPFVFMKDKIKYRAAYYIYHFFFRIILGLIGIFVYNSYESPKAKIKTNRIIISNHLSYLDAFVCTLGINNIFRPLGKIEISKLPLIGFLYKQYVIMVDRKNLNSKVESLKEMQHTLNNGDSVLIYPEGTFYKEISKHLNDFKDGAFHLAISQKSIIQPILLINTRTRLNPKNIITLNPGFIIIHFFDPIDTSNYNLEDTKKLKDEIHAKMLHTLKNLNYPKLNS